MRASKGVADLPQMSVSLWDGWVPSLLHLLGIESPRRADLGPQSLQCFNALLHQVLNIDNAVVSGQGRWQRCCETSDKRWWLGQQQNKILAVDGSGNEVRRE